MKRVGMMIAPFVLLAAAWQVVAMLGIFNAALFPSVPTIISSFWDLLITGRLISLTAVSMARLLVGFLVGSAFGMLWGMLMAFSKTMESLFEPILSVLLPIPSLAWIPILILWFGLGNVTTVLLVAFAGSLPMALNTWTGLKSVNSVWIRASESMGVKGLTQFWKVTFWGALPSIMTGWRLALSMGWRALVAGEMLAGVKSGLGWLIFNAGQFLQSAEMMAGVIMIGAMGVIVERVAFARIERATVVKWGMTAGKAQ